MLVAPLFMRDEFRGMMVVATPEEMPALRRRQPPGAVFAGGARARERGAHRGSAAPSERGAVRVAGQELVGRRDGHRADDRGPLREPVRLARARHRPRTSWRARASSTWSTRTTRRACCRSSRRPATVRATPASWSSACATATARTWPPRRCARACCTTRTSSGIVLNTRDITERKQFEGAAAAPGVPRPDHQPRQPGAVPRPRVARDRAAGARRASRSRCCSWTSTTSRRSTTRSATRRATGSCSRSGDRLKNVLRAADTAARLGGDEFAILLEDGGEGIQAADVADRIMQMLEDPVRAGRQGGVHPRERRHRRLRERRRGRRGRRRGADAQRRRRDVHGEGEGQGPLPGLRARDARHRAAAPGAEGRPPARARARRVHPALPARDRAGLGQDHRRRGADPLDPPRPRHRAAARVHPARRGDRA